MTIYSLDVLLFLLGTSLLFHVQLHASECRIPKYKKAFLSDQGKEIEENNRKGKTRDLVKKIGNTKGTFHAKRSTIKNRTHLLVSLFTKTVVSVIKLLNTVIRYFSFMNHAHCSFHVGNGFFKWK